MADADETPRHYCLQMRRWLDDIFPRDWIGRRGPTEWAPRSPDLNPLDFAVWVFLKASFAFSKSVVWCAVMSDGIIGPYFFEDEEEHPEKSQALSTERRLKTFCAEQLKITKKFGFSNMVSLRTPPVKQ